MNDLQFTIYNKVLSLLFVVACSLSFVHFAAASVLIEVDTQGQSINAIEGEIILPKDMKVDEIRSGQSVLMMWVSAPKISDNNTLSFAGLTPGGFSGRGNVVTLVGDFGAYDLNLIKFNNVIALKNDGDGSRTPVVLNARLVEDLEDNFVPERFKINLTKNPDVYDGNLVAIFEAEDKQSGVAKYQVAEKALFAPRESDWQDTTSPYVVMDKRLIKKLYVRAVDWEDNSTVESVSLPNRKNLTAFLVIIILALIYLSKRKWRKEPTNS